MLLFSRIIVITFLTVPIFSFRQFVPENKNISFSGNMKVFHEGEIFPDDFLKIATQNQIKIAGTEGSINAPTEGSMKLSSVAPSVFWISDPVLPGEVVMLVGANWGDKPLVELNWLQDGKQGMPVSESPAAIQKSSVIKPLQVTSSSLKFLIPTSWKPGVYSFQIVSGEARSEPAMINQPDSWWQQGDWGREASPGGWLRVFGKCLSINGKSLISLKGPGSPLMLTPGPQDNWSLKVDLPQDLLAGEYETWIHNGSGSGAAWKMAGIVTIKPHPLLWKPDVFDVRNFGAKANDEFDDSAPFQAALDEAGRNGGGIVSVPIGRFQINKTLLIPRLVLIRGEGKDVTQLYWRDRIKPLKALMRGTNSFGVEDLSIMAFNHMGGIVSDAHEKTNSGNVFIRRLQIRLNRFEQVPADEAARRLMPMGGQGTSDVNAIAVGGENIQVTDCEIYSSKSPFTFEGRYGVFSGNSCFQGGTAHFFGGTEIIFENNVVEGGMVARGGYADISRTFYSGNRVGNMSLHDSEIFTTDGNWNEPVKLVDGKGTHFVLDKDVNWKQYSGGALSIAHGKGAGQYRRIVSYDGSSLVLDQPWQVLPDEASSIIISRHYQQNLFIGNDFHDGAIVQNFTRGLHWIFAGNKITRVGGIHNAGRGTVPSWYSQYFENEILVGNGTRGPWNEQPPLDAHLEVKGDGARGAVFRRNILHNNARIEVSQAVNDVIIDHNIIRKSDAGIVVSESAKGILLWHNRFERVKNPLPGLKEAYYIHPAERILNRLSADGLIPESIENNPAWQLEVKNLEQILAKEDVSLQTADEVRSVQIKMLGIATDTMSKDFPFSLLHALTGLSFAEKSSPGIQEMLGNATGGSGEISIIASIPAWSIPMTLSETIPPIPLWKTSTSDILNLIPGKSVVTQLNITMPAGVWGKPLIPVICKVLGEGWNLQSVEKIHLGNGGQILPEFISQWMVIGPFSSDKPGELGEKVYPPERRLNIFSDYPGTPGTIRWEKIEPGEKGTIDFNQHFGFQEKGVAFGVSVLHLARPATVSITINGGTSGSSTVTYLDGELIGVPFRYGTRQLSRCLEAGDHILLCGVARNGNIWQLGVQVTVDPSAEPGDVMVLPVEKFKNIASLVPPADLIIPEGKDLPFSDGYDWRLVFEDDFNRFRLGEEWVVYEPQAWYESKSWQLEEGHLSSQGISYFEYLSYAKPLKPPVRVECDFTGDTDRINDWFQAITLTPHDQVGGRRLWGKGENPTAGTGYMLAPGWNRNPNSAALWRKEKQILVNLQSPKLESGKTKHIIAQFSPERILLIVDGVVSLEFKDPEWINDLNTVSLMNGFGREWFDNVRIYEARP